LGDVARDDAVERDGGDYEGQRAERGEHRRAKDLGADASSPVVPMLGRRCAPGIRGVVYDAAGSAGSR